MRADITMDILFCFNLQDLNIDFNIRIDFQIHTNTYESNTKLILKKYLACCEICGLLSQSLSYGKIIVCP